MEIAECYEEFVQSRERATYSHQQLKSDISVQKSFAIDSLSLVNYVLELVSPGSEGGMEPPSLMCPPYDLALGCMDLLTIVSGASVGEEVTASQTRINDDE